MHPFTRALYEQDGHGHVRVTRDGKVGIFTTEGQWLDGELYEADPHLCGWVGGPKLAHHRISHSS
ncbi:MAG: hypothetical protein U0Q03_08215 [Acidimicrobiales bacterium]